MTDRYQFATMTADELRAEAASRGVPLTHLEGRDCYVDTIGDLNDVAQECAAAWGVDKNSLRIESFDGGYTLSTHAPLDLGKEDDRRFLFDKLVEHDRRAAAKRERDLRDLERLKAEYEGGAR